MKRALLVGIDSYQSFRDLAGCVNDVDAIEPLLSRNEDGSPNFECQKRTSAAGQICRDDLLDDLGALLGPGADLALLYFAGHGAEMTNDVSLATSDATQATPGVALSEVMTRVVNSPVREVVLLLDCCFAGSAAGVPQLGVPDAALRSGTSILAASRGDQTAAETLEGRGLFSTFVGGALDGGAADVVGKVTVAGLYAYLDESFGAWDQRPVFKANVDRLHEIRACKPAVPLDELRRLTDLFSEADYEFPLDPSFEPEADPAHADNEAIFATLQRYRAAKLLEPVDAEHMYFAAMESKACRLTPLGQHYWHMANSSRL